MKNIFPLVCAVALTQLVLAAGVHARSNVLSGGLSTSYDYSDRQYSSAAGETFRSGDSDKQSFGLTPSLQYVSLSPRDRFEVSLAPTVKYDLEDSETDLDGLLTLAAERSLTSKWSIEGTNTLLRTDYYNNSTAGEFAEPQVQEDPTPDPQLSADLGRTRYLQNTFDVATDYRYRPDSQLHFGFNWIVLRYDDTQLVNEDYDRYSLELGNEHRYTSRWKTSANVSYVVGDYEADSLENFSNDLQEYHLLLNVENNSIDRHPLTLSYNYLGTEYDSELLPDSEAHSLRLNWRYDISPLLYTNVGLGPSYQETDGQDGNWGTNGIAEIHYTQMHSTYSAVVENGYQTNNFSGTGERGIVEFWDVGLNYTQALSRYLTWDARLGYHHEDRDTAVVVLEDGETLDGNQEDQYIAGVGLSYIFLKDYSLRCGYTFITQDSDMQGSDYDDHRILVSLSWNRELKRW